MSRTTNNPWFKAKKLLIADYTAGRILDHGRTITINIFCYRQRED
jgi:hypothetical protein